jgi:hypothetical protein
MKHAQRTEKYIRLIFNSFISDDDFCQKSMRIIDTNYFFSGDFQGQEGVRIMHQCALCNPKYGTLYYIMGYGYGAYRHFQQYFSYIVTISFIGGGNQSTRRKQLTCCKSLTNFYHIMLD